MAAALVDLAAMTIAEIWRYPIKSVGGERLESAELTELGIAGDRRWGIADLQTDTVLTARRAPELLFASATLVDDEVRISVPDGPTVSSTDTDRDTVLSEWLGRPVELRRAGNEGGTYEVPLDFEADQNWVSWQGPGHAWHDSSRSRVSLVSQASLGDWDQRRFRTNIILAGIAAGAEDAMVGHTVPLGSATLDITKRIDRCVIVTRPQPGLERDLEVLRTINAQSESCLAIGAMVATPGRVWASPIST